MRFRIEVSSKKRIEAINITEKVEEILKKSQIKNGIILIYVPHTTAAITINEAYDANVMEDFLSHLSKVIPYDGNFQHSEGNADAHIKSSLIGNQRFIFIEDGRLLLGRWEGIFFLEFDGPRKRNLILKVFSFSA